MVYLQLFRRWAWRPLSARAVAIGATLLTPVVKLRTLFLWLAPFAFLPLLSAWRRRV